MLLPARQLDWRWMSLSIVLVMNGTTIGSGLVALFFIVSLRFWESGSK